MIVLSLHKMRHSFALIIILFFMACTSLSSDNLIEAPKNSNIYFVSTKINNLCFQSKNPQFLINFSSVNPRFDFQIEGVWKNDYKILNMQILGAFGEIYASFELNEQKFRALTAQKNVFENQEIKNLIAFISSVGATELRNLFCGSYAITKNKKIQNIYLKQGYELKKDTFFILNDMNVDGRSLKIESDLELIENHKEEGYNLKTNSIFSYGFFGTHSQFSVEWFGYIDAAKLYPKKIIFVFGKNNYELKILDYN